MNAAVRYVPCRVRSPAAARIGGTPHADYHFSVAGLRLAPESRTAPMHPRSARGLHRRRGAGSRRARTHAEERSVAVGEMSRRVEAAGDRKSTRLNSSHVK